MKYFNEKTAERAIENAKKIYEGYDQNDGSPFSIIIGNSRNSCIILENFAKSTGFNKEAHSGFLHFVNKGINAQDLKIICPQLSPDSKAVEKALLNSYSYNKYGICVMVHADSRTVGCKIYCEIIVQTLKDEISKEAKARRDETI